MTEAQEQALLFEWAEFQSRRYPELKLMFHISNEGTGNIVRGRQQKRAGVKAGVPDIFLPVGRGGCLGMFVEMKKAHGGKLSENQKKWLNELTQQGYYAVVAHGFNEAQELILNYIKSV